MVTKSKRVTRAKPKPAVATKAERAAASRTMRAATAKAEMLIRRPVADVFIAFVDPLITSNFWFTKGSDRLHMARRSAGTGRCTASPSTSRSKWSTKTGGS